MSGVALISKVHGSPLLPVDGALIARTIVVSEKERIIKLSSIKITQKKTTKRNK